MLYKEGFHLMHFKCTININKKNRLSGLFLIVRLRINKGSNNCMCVFLPQTHFIGFYLACLHDQNKCGFFWRAGFYLANQSNLKGFQKALIGWKKAGPPKKPLLF